MPSTNGARDIARLLGKAAQPAYTLNADRKLSWMNAACAAWLGHEADSLSGQECRYHSAAPPGSIEEIAAALCPPPQALAGEACQGAIAVRSNATEGAEPRFRRRRAWFQPLVSADGDVLGVLCVLDREDMAEAPATYHAASTAEDLHAQLQRARALRHDRLAAEQFIGVSAAARLVRSQLQLAAESLAAAIIVGPPGSGRETLARSVHARGLANGGTLIPLACPLLDDDLLEATLAAVSRTERAGDTPPTLLLANVDELPPGQQAALHQFLGLPARCVRLLSTSGMNLAQLVAQDRFHAGLAAQLGTLAVALPPLVDRPEDLPLSAQRFLEALNAAGPKQLAGFSEEALDCLASHSWPGDLAELAAAVRHAHEHAAGSLATLPDLPPKLRLAQAADLPPAIEESIQLEPFLAGLELELIRRALKQSKGNKTQAAKLLGLPRSRFHRRLLQLGLETPADAPEDIVSFEEI